MRQNKKIIVITGGIASGKSTASAYIREKGYTVLDSDEIVHELYRKGNKAYNDIVNLINEDIFDINMEIDRKKLAKIVFADDKKRKEINKIVHKLVVEELNEAIANTEQKIVFLDIPLAIEENEKLNEYGLNYDELWLVYTNRELQLKRLLERDSRGEEESLRIINAQMDMDEKRKYADKIIENDETLGKLKKQIDCFLEKICE
jgi:dephospho-CoA kinase